MTTSACGTTIPIPKLYWDTFQLTLQAKVKRLVKDIASTLCESERPLVKALSTETVSAYLFEEDGSEMVDLASMRCRHLKPHPENAALEQRCRQPVILGKTACLEHELRGTTTLAKASLCLKTLRDPDGNTYFLDKETVLNSELECVGVYSNDVLRMFRVTT